MESLSKGVNFYNFNEISRKGKAMFLSEGFLLSVPGSGQNTWGEEQKSLSSSAESWMKNTQTQLILTL